MLKGFQRRREIVEDCWKQANTKKNVQIMHVHQIDLFALREAKVNRNKGNMKEQESNTYFSLVPMHNATLHQECRHNMPLAKQRHKQHVAPLNIMVGFCCWPKTNQLY